jgi:hypothetical protein
MKERVTLIFLKPTRQVLAALTRAAIPESALLKGNETPQQIKDEEEAELRQLVGQTLVARSFATDSDGPITTNVSIPAAALGVLTVDFEQLLLIEARSFIVGPDNTLKRGLDGNFKINGGATNDNKIEVQNAKIIITLASNVTEDKAVWIATQTLGKEPVFQTEKIKSNTKSVELAFDLPGSEVHSILISIAGFQPVFFTKKIS